MRNPKKWIFVTGVVLLSGFVIWRAHLHRTENGSGGAASETTSGVKPALTITTTSLLSAEWPFKLSATGTIEAWQEASVGSEVNGLRLAEVNVNVGDTVKRGQILARFSEATIKADVAQAHAAVAEAEAMRGEATANADRTRKMQAPGVISDQQINAYLTAEKAALARLELARAQLTNQETRLEQTQLVAMDDGVISARPATVGSVVSAGQELFRLIRFNRLEWRAEVTAADLSRVQVNQPVTLLAPDGAPIKGTVRMVAPTVDRNTRMALIYVDIPSDRGLKAGMFTRGDFEIGRSSVMSLPQSAVIQREGFHYAYRVGNDHRIAQVKVDVGRRLDDRVEILSGLEPGAKVVSAGIAFLADGDTVRVVDSPETQAGTVP